ncbi:MAG: 3-deoxy-manno-octulosonate cytidylyltransferase [Terriglobia bacterium]
MVKLRILAGIPARYSSSRFPGKALAAIAGRPMIEHVYRRVAGVQAVERVVVATDDERIVAAVRAFGGEVRLTRADHPSGTDRLAELAAGERCDLVVNVQGDEPLIAPQAIEQALAPFRLDSSLQVSTLKTLIRNPEELENPNVVKVTTDAQGFALSFSRAPLPGPGPHCKHLGLYVYTRDFLLRFAQLPPSPREQAERLEQWRILENGYRLLVVETQHDSIGVDTPADLARVEACLR